MAQEIGGVYGRAAKESSRLTSSGVVLRRVRPSARYRGLSTGGLASGHQREGEAKVAADKRYEEPDEPGSLPGVGYVGVLFRLGPLPVRSCPVLAAPITAGDRPVNEA